MKLFITLLLSSVIICNINPVFAQDATPTPAPQTQIQWMNEFTVNNQPSAVITLLKKFIEGFDSFMGGFVFYTPNPLGSTITLKDKSEIPGVTKYRDIFYQIAIPVLAIIISAVAISKIGSDNLQELKSFGIRFLITIILFITVPYVLTYSIQANNLLVNKISNNLNTTTFLNDYFDKSQNQITQGEDSEKYGIPSFDVSLRAGILQSLGKFVVQILLFALTFIFLLCAFIYIGFQFVIRFATLLFLAVLFPVIIPFVLSRKTEGIVHSYFRIWFTSLIQQPAFVLGFAIATDIFASILAAKGPSVGMLFFYTGFLFFLGGVNMLVSRIFGDAWTAMSTNMQAAIVTRSIASPVQSRFQDFKRGLIGGSVSNVMGREIRQRLTKGQSTGNTDLNNNGNSNKDKSPEPSSGAPSTQAVEKQNTGSKVIPQFSRALSNRGLEVKMENQKQGVVSLTGEAYQYNDPKTGLTSIYPNRLEATQDGIPEEKLDKISLDQSRFIDLSTFNKANPNPHNYNAMQESKKQGRDIGYAYINESSPPQKIRHFLEVSKPRNEVYGIRGIIVKRQGKETSNNIIRMYSHKPYEKRKDL